MKQVLWVILLGLASQVFADCVPGTQTAPKSAFSIDEKQGYAIDKRTNLMWKLCAEGQTFNARLFRCDGQAQLYFYPGDRPRFFEFTEFNNWRVPTSKELRTIVEKTCTDPAVNVRVFPDTPSYYFWSKTTWMKPSSARGWAMDFKIGLPDSLFKTQGAHVRLVREVEAQ